MATGNGGSDQAGIAAIPIRAIDALNSSKGYGRLTLYFPVTAQSSSGSLTGLVLRPRSELLVGERGESSDVADSRLTFYRLEDGKVLLSLATGLYDMTGLAYGAPQPPSNVQQLYALDFATHVPDAAGLYRLDAQQRDHHVAIAPVKIAALDRPTAIVLSPDGSLFVTLQGADAREDQPHPGKVVRFAPGL